MGARGGLCDGGEGWQSWEVGIQVGKLQFSLGAMPASFLLPDSGITSDADLLS